MGAMAVVFDKKRKEAISTVLKMLEEMKHRGTASPKVATHPTTFIAQSMSELTNEQLYSHVAVGTNNSEPALGRDFTWVLEGQFFSPSASIMDEVKHEMGQHPLKVSRCILKEVEGSYTFGLAFRDKIVVARDKMGIKPLYYGENESVCAAATERKALWKIGISAAYSFPPGNLAIMRKTGFVFEPIAALEPVMPKPTRIIMSDAAAKLQELLLKSTKRRVSDIEKAAVAFSGGLDSGIVAFLAKLAGVKVHLICVGLEGQSEIERAKQAAEILELPLSVQIYTAADVEKILPKTLWLIEEADVMKASVAIPFFWVAEVASKLNHNVLLAGQGADELFGGYQRYLTDYATGGLKKIKETLHRNTVMSYETNFQRDEPVCAYHKVELRLPFADSEVVNFALSLPVNLKIESPQDSLRKRVLREVARNLGIPSFISDRAKKAVQFSTGIDKALKLSAKNEGLTQRSYVENVFRQVYPSLGAPNQ